MQAGSLTGEAHKAQTLQGYTLGVKAHETQACCAEGRAQETRLF